PLQLGDDRWGRPSLPQVVGSQEAQSGVMVADRQVLLDGHDDRGSPLGPEPGKGCNAWMAPAETGIQFAVDGIGLDLELERAVGSEQGERGERERNNGAQDLNPSKDWFRQHSLEFRQSQRNRFVCSWKRSLQPRRCQPGKAVLLKSQ